MNAIDEKRDLTLPLLRFIAAKLSEIEAQLKSPRRLASYISDIVSGAGCASRMRTSAGTRAAQR
jgi:hypothetical protein